MSAENPEMRINFEDGELLATPANTELYAYIAIYSMYSHILLGKETVGDVVTGVPIFESNEAYKTMEDYMRANNYPTHDNIQEVPENVVNAFDRMIANSVQFEDFVPGEWSEEA